MSDTRWVCIHGHFYQPPRENPWLDYIEQQDSAYPYHDWNERITAEAYGPNAEARILDARDRITRIVNNYASISYNFGPTLLAWLQRHAPDTYASILAADHESAEQFGGHGSAMAQAYNHTILPLSNARDRHTQVVWGIRDFEFRFGRAPEGMWLPETAVDTASLETLAVNGIRFTVLAPHQAGAVRRIGTSEWTDVHGARIDTTRAYRCLLPSGRHIDLFFYDGPVSRAVAFEGLLKNGELLANRVLGLLRDEARPMLAHIATDGETYGHHHRHGEMALAYALHYIRQNRLGRLTNYAEFLEHAPPELEVRIVEATSWSCAHGLERWRSDCGCSTGGLPQWHQRWRGPLRDALDLVRDHVAPLFEQDAAALLRDPWAARDSYIDVVLDKQARLEEFFAAHARPGLDAAGRVRALKLLELQRNAMLMYTSCGWFFNEVSGIETEQVLLYAGRVIQLAEQLFGDTTLEPMFCARLELAESNQPDIGNARVLYEQRIVPAKVDLVRVAAHYAVDSVFGAHDIGEVYSYTLDEGHSLRRASGETQLVAGRARITSNQTGESEVVTYAVLHLGGHNIAGGIRRFQGKDEYESLVQQLIQAYESADLSAVVRQLAHFPEYPFSLKSLFRDRQREVLYRLLQSSVHRAEVAYRRVYQENAPFTRFLVAQDLPLPRAFMLAAEFVLNLDLRIAFDRDDLDIEHARSLLADAASLKVPLDRAGLAFAMKRTLERLAHRVRSAPDDVDTLDAFSRAATLATSLPVSVDLWKVQNVYYELFRNVYPIQLERATAGSTDATRWVDLFTIVGEQLQVAVQ